MVSHLKKRLEADNILQKWWQADCTDDLSLLANTPPQAKSLLHNLEQPARGIGLYENINKTELIYFIQGVISTLSGKSLKLISQFIYLGSNISSTESDVSICFGKVWTAIVMLSDI